MAEPTTSPTPSLGSSQLETGCYQSVTLESFITLSDLTIGNVPGISVTMFDIEQSDAQSLE